MTTLWNKLKETEIIYRLDEQSTIGLHPAKHDSISPRLLCILKDDCRWYVNTICLSDFIRSSKQQTIEIINKTFLLFCLESPSKRKLLITNSTGIIFTTDSFS